MDRINIAVLDDNKTALYTIASSVENVFRQHGYEPTVRCFETIRGIWDAAGESRFDLMLLDINVLDGDGIYLAKRLREKDKLADIIFVSNREDKVFDALQVHPYGFIRKNKFLQDASAVLGGYIEDRKHRQTGRAIIFDAQGQACRLNLDEIVYIEGCNKVRNIYLSTGPEPYTVTESLESLEETLKKDGFLRVHKGYLVNCKFIRLILNTELLLLDDRRIPVSRRKLTEVKEAYFDYMQGQGAKLL
ncbi:MAG: LytR/AlgR family response regulator transcription factor [Faecousia sp.]